jgi:hypothetical protein
MRPDDAFWAARIVSKFSDDAIRAVVEKAQYSDRRATDYITETLILRRDKVLRAWLAGVNPLVDFAIGADGELTFENAAVQARIATPARQYRYVWARFDNATGTSTPIDAKATVVTTMPRAAVPQALADAPFIEVSVEAVHPDHPAWSSPVIVHFRRAGGGWELVGALR